MNPLAPVTAMRIVLAHIQLWNRSNELAAPIANVRQLRGDFLAQVPGKNHHVIRARLLDAGLGDDRNARAGEVAALLVRRGVYHVAEQVWSYTGVIEQGVAFGGGAVAHDVFPVALASD